LHAVKISCEKKGVFVKEEATFGERLLIKEETTSDERVFVKEERAQNLTNV
jgi:hypothetical protein